MYVCWASWLPAIVVFLFQPVSCRNRSLWESFSLCMCERKSCRKEISSFIQPVPDDLKSRPSCQTSTTTEGGVCPLRSQLVLKLILVYLIWLLCYWGSSLVVIHWSYLFLAVFSVLVSTSGVHDIYLENMLTVWQQREHIHCCLVKGVTDYTWFEMICCWTDWSCWITWTQWR